MKRSLLAALAALALPLPAFASGVIDNVNGITLDQAGKVIRFRALVIDDEGKVEKLLPGRYEAPPRKKKLKKGESKIVVAFLNDTYKENEYDSNLYIHSVKLEKK